jgi:hypothetical protein
MLTIYDLKQNKKIQGAFEDIPRKNERPIAKLWPSAKTSMDYFMNAHLACQYDFMQNIMDNRLSTPDFSSAVKVQEMLEAAYLSAAEGAEKVLLPLP